MSRILSLSFCTLFVSAAIHAATIDTTLSVTNATGTLDVSTGNVTIAGPATLTNIGGGAFTSAVSLAGISPSSPSVTVPFTITLSSTAGTITGNLTFPSELASGTVTSGTGSASITGGTYNGGVTGGSFQTLNGASNGSLTTNNLILSFTGSGTVITVGSPTPPSSVIISNVLDAASYTPNIAEGGIFVVKGTNLSPSGHTVLGFPLPTTSNGVSIAFTPVSGGTATLAYLVGLYNEGGVNQLAAVLPSSLPTGDYNVTVTNGSGAGNTSAPFLATVVEQKFGLVTQDTTGTGLAVVQNYISTSELDVNRLTTGTVSGMTISPATPGQTLIAWGTGLGGGVLPGDNTAQEAYDFTQNGVSVQVLVGGVEITPTYAGSAPGLAGVNQIDFTLPADVPTGCAVPFQVLVNGQLSNLTSISIAPTEGVACVAPGFTSAQLQQLDQGGTYVNGSFSLDQNTASGASAGNASGAFTRYTGFQMAALLAALAPESQTTSGSCQVFQSRSDANPASTSGTGLDAGTVALTGPAGSNLGSQALKQDPNTKAYSLLLGSGIVPGTYTLNGAGGADVGSFSASAALGSPLTINGGLPGDVDRSAGLALEWTGGNGSDLVQISGSSNSTFGTGANVVTISTQFICTTTAGAGGFIVPPSILLQLPAVSSTGGSLAVFSGPTPSSLSAALTAGGSVAGTFGAFAGSGGQAAYQ